MSKVNYQSLRTILFSSLYYKTTVLCTCNFALFKFPLFRETWDYVTPVVKEMWKYWATNLWNKARIINSRRIWLESGCDRICLWIDNWTSYWVFRHLKKDKLVYEKFGVHLCRWWWAQLEALILDSFTVIVIIVSTSLLSHAYAWIHLNIYNKMHNIIPIYNLNTIDSHFYILLTL